MQEVDQNEKLRIQVKQLESRLEKQQQQQQEEEEQRQQQLTGAAKRDSKEAREWKAMMQARAAEEKAQALQEELDAKVRE